MILLVEGPLQEFVLLAIAIGSVLLRLILKKLDRVVKETEQNGGKSLKDHLVRIEDKIADVKSSLEIAQALDHNPIFRTDVSGRCLWVNDKYLETIEADHADVLGTGWTRFMHPEDADLIVSMWILSVNEEKKFDLRFRVISSSKQVKAVKCIAYPVIGSHKELKGYVGSWVEVENLPEIINDQIKDSSGVGS